MVYGESHFGLVPHLRCKDKMHYLSFLEICIIGFLAQIIDGTLGMGYGVTSSVLLICLGVYPVIASASVHTAELCVTFVSGISHFKFGNVRKDLL